MAQTLLQLCQQASREMGIAAPATIISNTAQLAVSLLNLINGVGQQLVTEHEWQKLDIEYRFTTVFYEYTANQTADSVNLTALSSATGLTTNPTYFGVTGNGINQDTYLATIDGGALTATLSQAATQTITANPLTFAQIRYAFPADFDRMVDRTYWDKSKNWQIYGPETGQQWQWLKSGFSATGPVYRFRQLGGLFQIWPPLNADDYVGFEYISNYWVATSASAAGSKTAFTVDTDVCLFPDRLMIDGLKYRFAEQQGLERTPMYEKAWRRQLDIAKAADAGAATLSMAPRPASVLLNWWNIPDSGLGS